MKNITYLAQPIPTPDMSLEEAGRLWIALQSTRRRPKTIECNRGELKRLTEFFGDVALSEFHIGHFEHYQAARQKVASASATNHELNALARILRLAGLWEPIRKRYSPLKETAWKAPKIFTEDEQATIFRTLESHPDLELANIVFTITRNTTASGCELRGLRLRDLDLEAKPEPLFHIPESATKNSVRPRTIPLNGLALNAFRRAVERAKKLGCHYPENFLFPYQVNRALWDPRRPASKSWLRHQVVLLRELTGIENINPHVFRHLAVTELLESGEPEETVIAVAGWIGRRMIETYSHARIKAKAKAVKRLDNNVPKETPPPLDIMSPAIQAEIARQVAIALAERDREQHYEPVVAREQSSARLVVFPGGATCR